VSQRRRRERRQTTAALAAVVMLLASACASHDHRAPALDPTRPTALLALVDAEPARLLLVDLMNPGTPDARLARGGHAVLDASAVPGNGHLPDQASLREVAQNTSLDYAALTFAHALRADRRNSVVQAAFERFLDERPVQAEAVLEQPGAFPHTVLFAPSWMYQSAPGTGADFARQRRLLDRLGIPHRLIHAAETGSVEDNAAIVATAVREAGRRGERVVLVSASKSGAEVALALGRLLAPEEATHVAGWLNVAGALGGSPLADSALRPPAAWIARLAFWLTGWNWDGLASMGTERSRRRLEQAVLPESVAVLNLVAIPVSGSVSYKVAPSYELLRDHGPNDGVVLLTDTYWPGGTTIVALGEDHLLGSLQGDAYSLALLRVLNLAVRLHDGNAYPQAPVGE
jgi:hypothetical protein